MCRHRKIPDGYLAAHEWAAKMLRTHTPRKCRVCGKWAIWTKRKTKKTSSPA